MNAHTPTPHALDILLHMPCAAIETPALHAAAFLAQRLQARLDALCVVPIPPAAFSVPETVTYQLDETAQRCEEAEQLGAWYHAQLGRRQLDGNWLVARGESVQALCHVAAGYDLLVLQRGSDRGDVPIGFGMVSRSVFGSRVPALVIPETPRTTEPGRRIVLAWNGSRESALAARGALPLLRHADQVLVLEGRMAAGGESLSRVPSDLAEWLQRRDIRAQIEPFNPEGAAGPALIDACHAAQADLLVMGAWGRSRISEMVLGGATRHLFLHGDIPMLVAH